MFRRKPENPLEYTQTMSHDIFQINLQKVTENSICMFRKGRRHIAKNVILKITYKDCNIVHADESAGQLEYYLLCAVCGEKNKKTVTLTYSRGSLKPEGQLELQKI